METAILLISCQDRKGIVAEISHFISTYNGNILHSSQHSDTESNTYFMRIEWDLKDFGIKKDKIAQAFEPVAGKFEMKWSINFSSTKKNVALFVSQHDHCLNDLLFRHHSGELDCTIRLIISNHETCRSMAEYFGIPYYSFSINKENKGEAEKEQLALLKKHKIDLIVLARYMQILTADFVRYFPEKIINIHHSFLPAFIGARPYHQAHARGVKIIGATSHYVTADLDQGPIIEQDVSRISHRDSVAELVQKGKNLEVLVLSRAVKLYLEDKILVFNNKTVVFD
ncbi:MAG: formyltetrahydrofolate deformylase [Spirochaetales bacterium]|nr:formyltetrahydrofolate deformylase [Spirochaetales bacterium]